MHAWAHLPAIPSSSKFLDPSPPASASAVMALILQADITLRYHTHACTHRRACTRSLPPVHLPASASAVMVLTFWFSSFRPCLMMSTMDLRWGSTAQPMRMAICWMILMPVWRACQDFLDKQTACRACARACVNRVCASVYTLYAPYIGKAAVQGCPGTQPNWTHLRTCTHTHAHTHTHTLRKGSSAGMPSADATTLNARAVVLRTYSSMLSISGRIAAIICARPAALDKLAMISRPCGWVS